MDPYDFDHPDRPFHPNPDDDGPSHVLDHPTVHQWLTNTREGVTVPLGDTTSTAAGAA